MLIQAFSMPGYLLDPSGIVFSVCILRGYTQSGLGDGFCSIHEREFTVTLVAFRQIHGDEQTFSKSFQADHFILT